jgi:hypothetical protein
MTDYQKEYRQALRRGDTEKANEIYRERLKEDSAVDETVEDDQEPEESEDSEKVLEAPSDMTVGEAKEYASKLEGESLQEFYDMEVEGEDRKTLVEHLESELE